MRNVTWVCGIVLVCARLAISDEPRQGDPPETGEIVEFIDRYERRFAAREPKVGDLIEEFEAYDGAGERFQFRRTHGQYRVIVFGCLT